eukprot:comp18198_c0_seq2/m.19066 comp18198_c0_seq2/g.19066  ORF comp18198_c0_seq2/g.19066 comp18198_c0_seq2/m.19066 type:complete len:511 (-) comp18198_c0_seq2:217-1749(-)
MVWSYLVLLLAVAVPGLAVSEDQLECSADAADHSSVGASFSKQTSASEEGNEEWRKLHLLGKGPGADRERQERVVGMIKHAWGAYKTYAWGQNELSPLSRSHDNSLYGVSLGLTIIDSLDTLLLAGMHEEYLECREWIAQNLTFDVPAVVSVFEVNIRILGGLLSAYGLTKDPLYLEKSVELGDRLMKAFNSGGHKLPHNWINLATGQPSRKIYYVAAEYGTLQMEFEYLSDVTGDEKYRKAVLGIRDYILEKEPPNKLYRATVDPNGSWGTLTTLGGLQDSFFEYLLKAWLLNGEKDEVQRNWYYETMDALISGLYANVGSGGPLVNAYFDTLPPTSTMDHLACFAGGMFALGARHAKDPALHMSIAENVTATCRNAHRATPTGLCPEVIKFCPEGKVVKGNQNLYQLRPEAVESYFVLWRLTGDPKYRDWGSELMDALDRNAQTWAGYAVVADVWSQYPVRLNHPMPSFFIAETLKYLYLLYSDSALIPLDRYVFNTEAHPFPIAGHR